MVFYLSGVLSLVLHHEGAVRVFFRGGGGDLWGWFTRTRNGQIYLYILLHLDSRKRNVKLQRFVPAWRIVNENVENKMKSWLSEKVHYFFNNFELGNQDASYS